MRPALNTCFCLAASVECETVPLPCLRVVSMRAFVIPFNYIALIDVSRNKLLTQRKVCLVLLIWLVLIKLT